MAEFIDIMFPSVYLWSNSFFGLITLYVLPVSIC